MPQESAGTPQTPARYDAVVVGGGFAGLYSLHKLRGLGLKVTLETERG